MTAGRPIGHNRRKKTVIGERPCNLCDEVFPIWSKFQRFCDTCKNTSHRYKNYDGSLLEAIEVGAAGLKVNLKVHGRGACQARKKQ